MSDMDNRNVLYIVAVAATGLIVLIAVLSAGYMLVASLFGSPGPTAVPIAPTPTPYASIPSGQFIPGASSYPVVPTPVQSTVKSAMLAGNGTDKYTYNRGDTAYPYITIKNTGNVMVNESRLDISVDKYISIIGYVTVQSQSVNLTGLNIQPGETKNVTYAVTIPEDYNGIPTDGKYRIKVNVYVWDREIGSFQEEVEVK